MNRTGIEHRIGIDLGSSSVKIVTMSDGEVCTTWLARHHGMVMDALWEGLSAVAPSLPQTVAVAVTGRNAAMLEPFVAEAVAKAGAVADGDAGIGVGVGEIPAITEGVRHVCPGVGSVMEFGSQSSRFITSLAQKAPRFAVNEHCAGGTGSFFEDQMSRLGLAIEDFSTVVSQARSVPRLSGRCAVFAKTDVIHRQQEGASTPDILLGLCYAMVRNYKATIVRDLPLDKPVAFCGGVTRNGGVRRAIADAFGLADGELVVPEHAIYVAALGAAKGARATLASADLTDAVRRAREACRTGARPASAALAGPAETADPSRFRMGDPRVGGAVPADGCALGVDIGSTSTNLVLVGRDGSLVDFQYLRTAGDPERAVRAGLADIRRRFGEVPFVSVGVTGSGRERLGRMMGADAVRDEITAQAKAAARLVPDADTVFEIGGQDSKFIALRDGEVADFQMNKICAAGTGSFVEEQAARMGIPIDEFGPLALTSRSPADLGERCTVFIETAMASAAASGASQADLAAGLCNSIVLNYLHKVVGGKPVGRRIVLQGGVAYNPGIVAAFHRVFGDRLTVSPCFPVSGAYGAALLAMEKLGVLADAPDTAAAGAGAAPAGAAGANGAVPSAFKGFDFPGDDSPRAKGNESVRRNTVFYQSAGKLLLESYDGVLDPGRKTVGVPFALLIHKFFPMANAFFKSLGFNVLLSDPTDEETVRLSQETARGETCYPVKLVYGHMAQLAAKGVDYIFLPSVRTLRHETSRVANNYGCVFMQTAPRSVAQALHLEERGIGLLSPVFDLDFGKEAMAAAMLSVGGELGVSKPRCAEALLAGATAVREHTKKVEEQGRRLLSSLKPSDKVLVLITRNYGVSDPVLNMGIPQLLLERGHKVVTLSHLPAHDLDISASYPNLYWPFGQHILSGVKMVAHHPNLYAVYLTNHGCGPDSMLSHMVRQEMGDKPYLHIEVDEHFSAVGVVTRVEAFLNSLSRRPALPLPAGFDAKAVPLPEAAIDERPADDLPLYLPDLGLYTRHLKTYLETAHRVPAYEMGRVDPRGLELGRAETNAKEYLPFTALLDGVLRTAQRDRRAIQVLVPFTEGSEADGQYARGIRAILDRKGLGRVRIAAPVLERAPARLREPDFDLLTRAVLVADLLYAAPLGLREVLAPANPTEIPAWEGVRELAAAVASAPRHGKRLAAVGTPMCLTSLDGGVLDRLEREGYVVQRAPLAEYLWFLWNDALENAASGKDAEEEADARRSLARLRRNMGDLGAVLGDASPFAEDLDDLVREADRALPRFAGGNGRYRWAKAVERARRCDAVLTLAPRYENTSTVLDMRGLPDACEAPLFQLALDGDRDATAWSGLQSFLYYC